MSDNTGTDRAVASNLDHAAVSARILFCHDELARDLADRRQAVLGEMHAHYGIEPEKLIEYSLYEISWLASAIAEENPGLFREYVDWAKTMFESRAIPLLLLEKNLDLMRQALFDGLPPETHGPIDDVIRAGLEELTGPCDEVPSYIARDTTRGTLAREYLDAVLAGDRPGANRTIMDAFGRGVPIREIYLDVLQPVQYEIGRLWQTNRISVAQEHFASGVTQMIMSQLYYPHISSAERTGKTMVAICVSGELHEIGIRMIADLFELAGWEVYLLGANMPAAEIVKILREHRADLLGISAAMASSVNKAKQVIALVRASEAARVPIIVGGFAFNRDEQLWRVVGADHYARDAEAALSIGRHIAASGQEPGGAHGAA